MKKWIAPICLFLAFVCGPALAAHQNQQNQTDFNLNVTAGESTVQPGQTEKIAITAESDQRERNYHLVVTITFDGNVVDHYREELNLRANRQVDRTLSWRVPKNAPDGTYTVTVTIRHNGDVLEQDSTTFTVGSASTNPTPVAGQCGSANGTAVSSAPTGNLCTTGTASALTGNGPWNWSCAGTNGGASAQCTAPKTTTSTPVNGACGASNGVAASSAPSGGLCTTGTASSISGSGPWNWSCAGSNGGTSAQCTAPKTAMTTPVNGACGSSNGQSLASVPTANLCTTGTASSVAGSGPWSWSCAGSSGGTSAQCTAQKTATTTPVNGLCGASNNTAVSAKPTTGLCTTGTASAVSGAGPWNWSCAGSNGGITTQCIASVLSTTVNGMCGTAQGKTFSTAPTTNLCSVGTATTLTADGNEWIWNCVGSNGGDDPGCSAIIATTKVNGQCGATNGTKVTTPPTTGLCSTGTASSVTGSSSTDIWQWSCAGTGGGMNATCATASGSTTGGGGTGNWWMATPGSEWQWEIDHAIDTTSASDMGTGIDAYNGDTPPATNPVIYDIDGFDNDASTVTTLHGMGMKVVCYIEVGSAENYRPDYSEFPASVLGNTMPGYSAEKYIDISSPTVVSIIEARIQMCATKGFDAIEPDIDESYDSNTGFNLSKAIEESYMTTLTDYAHSLGVAMWGKNPDDTGDSYAADMVNTFDAILTEQCNEYGTCDALDAYATAGKAVFNAEYKGPTSSFCPADNARSNFNGVLFNVNLNGSRAPCK